VPKTPHGSEAAVLRSGYDRLLEHRSRLAICALLAGESGISFSRFKFLLNETDGNLGAQLHRLEEAGYVAAAKAFENRKPVSRYSLTAKGRKSLKRHIEALDALIRNAKA
jgi:DNA-binding MarR family transcriptional regulator